MASWYLLNTIKFNSSQAGVNTPVLLEAGKLIDDTKYSTTAIKAAGGVLAPSTDVAATAAALIATASRKGGQADQSPATLLDLTMVSAVAEQANANALTALSKAAAGNRAATTAAAGATVAAGAAICAAVAFTPTFSGKLLVRAYVSIQALAAATTFTPILVQAATTVVAPAQYLGAVANTIPGNFYLEYEVDGLTVGTPVTFHFTSTAGDATVTLGNGSTGIAARLMVQELP